MAARIVVVDDEPALLEVIAPLLRSRGYDVVTAATGQDGIELVHREEVDLLVLDLGLPDLDGVTVCRRVRADYALPILVLTVREAEADKVAALDAGADDYVTKPFATEEFLARVRALLRRGQADTAGEEQIVRGDLTIDVARRRVLRHGQDLRLTPREFELLLILARNSGRVLTHHALLKAIWGPYAVDQPQNLRVLIRSLRKKIEPDLARPRYLLTEPWVGYRFSGD